MANFMLTFLLMFSLLTPANYGSQEWKPAEVTEGNKQTVTVSKETATFDRDDDDDDSDDRPDEGETSPIPDFDFDKPWTYRFHPEEVAKLRPSILEEIVKEDGSAWCVVKRGGEVVDEWQVGWVIPPDPEIQETAKEEQDVSTEKENNQIDPTVPEETEEVQVPPEVETGDTAQPEAK